MANLEFDIREKILHTSTNLQVCLQCQYQLTQSWWRISRRGTISRFTDKYYIHRRQRLFFRSLTGTVELFADSVAIVGLRHHYATPFLKLMRHVRCVHSHACLDQTAINNTGTPANKLPQLTRLELVTTVI